MARSAGLIISLRFVSSVEHVKILDGTKDNLGETEVYERHGSLVSTEVSSVPVGCASHAGKMSNYAAGGNST